MTDREQRFGQAVFEFITTLIPYWRVSDDAWYLSDKSYLGGIGVLRNYRGDVLVIPLETAEDNRVKKLVQLEAGDVKASVDRIHERVIIVYDDRVPNLSESLPAEVRRFVMIPWSRRNELASFVIRDSP